MPDTFFVNGIRSVAVARKDLGTKLYYWESWKIMDKIKQVLKQHSQLNHFVSWVYSFVHNFGHLQRRVRCKGAYLNGVRFSIAVGSSVEIGNLARLHNCSF